MAKSDKFDRMIEAFECDFVLAKEGEYSIAELDNKVRFKDKKLMSDIDLLEELSFLLRNGKAEIHLVEEPKTKADRIRSMSDEELAEFASHYISCGYCDAKTLGGSCGTNCKKNLLDWLKSEAE